MFFGSKNGSGRRRIDRRGHRVVGRVEHLEARPLMSTITVDVGDTVRTVPDRFLGVDLTGSDRDLLGPRDAADPGGFDHDTVKLIHDAGLGILRLSDGGDADKIHFNKRRNGDSVVHAGILAAATRAAGADGLVTVNYLTGTPREAAAYVAYLNGNVGDMTRIGGGWRTVNYWARLRAAAPRFDGDRLDFLRVHQQDGFGFKNFEVGNEIYYKQESNAKAKPARYVTFAKRFAALTHRFDPDASVGLDVADPTPGPHHDALDPHWNNPLLRACKRQDFMPGFLSDHLYVTDSNDSTDLQDETLLKDSVSKPGSHKPDGSLLNWAGREAVFRALFRDLDPTGTRIELIAGEFNSDAASQQDRPKGTKQGTSLVNGLFVADAIGSALQGEIGYSHLIYWNLRNGYEAGAVSGSHFGWRPGFDYGLLGTTDDRTPPPETGRYVRYPSYFAEQLGARLIDGGGSVVKASSDGTTPTGDNVSAYAVRKPDGRLTLLIINKAAPNETGPSEIDQTFVLIGFKPAAVARLSQYGVVEDFAPHVTMGTPAELKEAPQQLDVTATTGGSQFHIALPNYSMTVLDLTPGA